MEKGEKSGLGRRHCLQKEPLRGVWPNAGLAKVTLGLSSGLTTTFTIPVMLARFASRAASLAMGGLTTPLQRPLGSIVATRLASTATTASSTSLGFLPLTSVPKMSLLSEQLSRLRPFSPPPAPVVETFELTSVLRKRRLKMNKHKHKKLLKRTRALRKRLGK
ncbi:hypothetical protein CLU79DRAFT_830163 [Phycomyces nitens]|nr:hypothetical protein CLU79DRAFT_830163 [Phycomyces nitens]